MAASVAQPPRKHWNRQELEALEDAGLLAGARVELLDEEVFAKEGQTPAHASAVCRLTACLIGIFRAMRVRTQMPVEPSPAEAARNLPGPDLAVTRKPGAAYRDRHPGSADVLLVAEVADSTYDYDVKRKGRLYARAAFEEYLVVDLNERELLVFRSPGAGVYTEMRVLRPGDSFHPAGAPAAEIAVTELFTK